MTFDEVSAAVQAIEAEGRRATDDAVRQRLGRGSRRDISLLMQIVRAQRLAPRAAHPPEEPPRVAGGDPEPLDRRPELAPEPDPVARDEQALAVAEQTFRNARAHLRDCRLEYLIVTLPLFYEADGKKLLVGSFDPTDEIFAEVLLDLRSAKVDYDRALQYRRAARETLAHAVKVHRRGLQERWVAMYKSALVEELDRQWERQRTATSDWIAADARQKKDLALDAYNKAVAAAPWDWHPNGTQGGP